MGEWCALARWMLCVCVSPSGRRYPFVDSRRFEEPEPGKMDRASRATRGLTCSNLIGFPHTRVPEPSVAEKTRQPNTSRGSPHWLGSPREATRNVMFRVVSASAMILALVLAAFIAPGSCARPVPAGHHAATHRVASPTQRQQETRGDDPRPLVGVLSQPRYWTGAPDAPGGYIAASYVKWLEAAGARAVPILYTDSNITIQRKLSAVNGVLLPGGDSDISPGTSLRAAGERASCASPWPRLRAGRCIRCGAPAWASNFWRWR